MNTYELTDTERRQLDACGITVVAGEVARLVVDNDRVTGVGLVDGGVVARTALFVRPGIRPHPDGLLAGVGCQYDDGGFVTTGGTGRTTSPGVWAAGNVADPRRRQSDVPDYQGKSAPAGR